MTPALASAAPTAVAMSLTAFMAFAPSLPRRVSIPLPGWLPWAFLTGLGIASSWFALGHPLALLEPGLTLPL